MKLLKILKLVQGQRDLLKWLAHLVGAVWIIGAEVTELPDKHGIFWPGEQRQCPKGCKCDWSHAVTGLIGLSLDWGDSAEIPGSHPGTSSCIL